MIPKRSLAAILLLQFFCCVQLKAQTEKVEVITLGLDGASISAGGFPFDIPFLMKFPVPENAKRVTFRYRISKHDTRVKKWIVFPKHVAASVIIDTGTDANDGWTKESETRTWKYDGQKDFVLKCDGLHPNINYDFYFEVFKAVSLDAGVKTKMKTDMLARILTFYNSSLVNGYQPSDKTTLETDLETILQTAVNTGCGGVQLREICTPSNAYSIKINNSTELGKSFNKIFGVSSAVENAIDLRNNNRSALATAFTNSKATILQEIADLNSAVAASSLTAASKTALDKPFITTVDEFKTITLQDAITVLSAITNDPNQLNMLVNGTGKIVNKSVVISPGNVNNLVFLSSLLAMFNSDALQGNGGRVFFKSIFNNINFSVPLVAIVGAESDLKKWTTAKDKLIDEFPDVSLQIVAAQGYTYQTISLADVSTDKTPYISAEGGIGYAQAFETGFSYYGVNFYLSPVNKKAKLSTLHGSNKYKKMICFNIGIVNFFGSRPKNSFSFLGETASSDIMAGIGVRLNRIIKLNFGCLPYKTSNINPLVDRKIIKADFSVSLGIDVNLLTGFSDVAKALKLIK